MAAFGSALIIGGGIAGMSAALSLNEAGVKVRLIDRDAQWGVSGAGITITGPTLRVMKRLGILDDVLKAGWTSDDIRACDAEGNVLAEIEGRTSGGDGIPGAGGIMRPTLHRLLAQRVRDEGIEVSLGLTVEALSDGSPKTVDFSDGRQATYDLVVAADGIFSDTRKALFPEVEGPKYVGQVCWRLMAPRHPGIDRRTYFLGGPMKIGMNPVSPDEMYMFLLEPVETVEWIPDDELSDRLARLMEGYGGIVADVRAGLTPDSNIVARPLETVVCPAPWYRDRGRGPCHDAATRVGCRYGDGGRRGAGRMCRHRRDTQRGARRFHEAAVRPLRLCRGQIPDAWPPGKGRLFAHRPDPGRGRGARPTEPALLRTRCS